MLVLIHVVNGDVVVVVDVLLCLGHTDPSNPGLGDTLQCSPPSCCSGVVLRMARAFCLPGGSRLCSTPPPPGSASGTALAGSWHRPAAFLQAPIHAYKHTSWRISSRPTFKSGLLRVPMCSYAKYMLLSYLAVDSEYAMINNLTLKGSTRTQVPTFNA